MVRTLTAKEKIYFILLLLPYILLIILSAVWVTNSQGQCFASEHITAFIPYICIGFLFYQEDFFSKKSAIKICCDDYSSAAFPPFCL